MNVRVLSATVRGVEADLVEIEIQERGGLARTTMIGLPDNVIRESRERIRAALAHSGFSLPRTHILINLAPARIPKSGPCLDLPIALGMAATQCELPAACLARVMAFGELRLDGRIRPVAGAVALAARARSSEALRILLPAEQAPLAAAISSIPAFGVSSLAQAVAFLRGEIELPPADSRAAMRGDRDPLEGRPDLAEVRGVPHARRALLLCAAGGHNLLLIGPPGVGKSMLARRLPGILPPPNLEEALEITRIHSLCDARIRTLMAERPFRAPHHSSSAASILGGSGGRPGELTLAHRGVLFLDELPEFARNVLEALRQPLEDGCLRVGRVRSSVLLPARTQVVAAMNPCPCGFFGHPSRPCHCSEPVRRRYMARISGPLLERFDLILRMHPIESETLMAADRDALDSRRASEIVRAAVARGCRTANAETDKLLKSDLLEPHARALLERFASCSGASARVVVRILQVAQTIRLVEDCEQILTEHIAEAISYRQEEELLVS